jgi:hypothetical protein
MGALKKLKKKLTSASSKKKFMNNDTNSKNTKTVLGDVTNASPGKSNKRGKTLKPFRTADVSSAKRSNTGGVSLKAVEIFEDDEAFEQRREGGSKAPPPSSASDSVSPASSKSSKSALDEWADHLILPVLLPVGGFNENKEEEKEQPETPTKTTDDDKDDDDEEVMNVVDSGFAASPIVVSYELSESECGTPGEVEERVLGNVESVVLANDNEAVDVAEEEGEDALESYLFTPPPVNLAKKDTLKEDAVEEEKNTNTQSARLSSSMWDVKMMHNVSFMKNVSAMDVAMGAGAAAVVFNFFMPSFLKASF